MPHWLASMFTKPLTPQLEPQEFFTLMLPSELMPTASTPWSRLLPHPDLMTPPV
jgi:hypothetical protein